jgi:pseudaminic acid cytidylyltransferase
MRVAIIPARGGSKRIPRKNIKPFCGLPMIAWSIKAAQQSECFDRILVTTDDEEIAATARQYGAETPFLRPASLSDDYTGTTAVITHAIEWMQEQQMTIDLACCIYATAPFIRAADLQSSLRIMKNEDASYCFSVTSYAFPIQRAIKITETKRCKMFQSEMFNQRSQDLEDAYHDAGQFYWGRTSAWIEEKPIFSKHSIPYILPRYRVQDIDTVDDWREAELMFQVLTSNSL